MTSLGRLKKYAVGCQVFVCETALIAWKWNTSWNGKQECHYSIFFFICSHIFFPPFQESMDTTPNKVLFFQIQQFIHRRRKLSLVNMADEVITPNQELTANLCQTLSYVVTYYHALFRSLFWPFWGPKLGSSWPFEVDNIRPPEYWTQCIILPSNQLDFCDDVFGNPRPIHDFFHDSIE